MKQRKWIESQGPIPGSGRRQETVSTRPDDPELVSRKQMKELVGVSSSAVITKALERWSIDPVSGGSKSIKTYNNGGSGSRSIDVPYHPVSAKQAVREELARRAQLVGDGRFPYEGVTLYWKEAE